MASGIQGVLTGHPVLMLAVLAWALAQVLKFFINLVVYHMTDLRLLLASGGMPSSHSATVCACAMSVGLRNGFQSDTFALAAVLAIVVMYDACNVRRAVGEQAKVLNYIVDGWEADDAIPKELKEILGHTPAQVFAGAVLGILVGWGGVMLFGA